MGDVVLGICQISDLGKEADFNEGYCGRHCEAKSNRLWVKQKYIRYPKVPGTDASVKEYGSCPLEYQNRKCKTCLVWFSLFNKSSV